MCCFFGSFRFIGYPRDFEFYFIQLFVKTWFFSYICEEVKKYIVVFYFDYIF